MYVIHISDIHQTANWKWVTELNGKFDYIIFHGDYFDFHGEPELNCNEAVDNFKEIVAFARLYPNKVILLFGNHDLQYLPGASATGNKQDDTDGVLQQLFYEARDLFRVSFEYPTSDIWKDETIVASHAGFTKTWWANTILTAAEKDKDILATNTNPFAFSNEILKRILNVEAPLDPNYKRWISYLDFSDRCWSPTGDSVSSGPLWVRPNSLFVDSFYKIQVVGHTPVNTAPLLLQTEDEYFKFVFIDTPEHNKYWIFNTEADFPVFQKIE